MMLIYCILIHEVNFTIGKNHSVVRAEQKKSQHCIGKSHSSEVFGCKAIKRKVSAATRNCVAMLSYSLSSPEFSSLSFSSSLVSVSLDIVTSLEGTYQQLGNI